MEYTSRKQRKERQEQTGLEEHDTINDTVTVQRADEELFKEQKKRLRRQLNSATTFSLDTNDMKVSPNSLQTRTEVKKQKKIDEILRDIAVLPENEYLNEDTNLRLLKKMSVAKKYNRLQLSPEQEEKMAENKEKFETITNQLWFLIRELEKGKVPEPEIGTIPTIASEDVSRNRAIFDVEQAKTAERRLEHTNITNTDFEMTSMNTKIDLLEEKLEKMSLKNDELEGVLQDLEKVVQEGKNIVNDEVEIQSYDIGEAPEDTLELLEYLEKLDALNKTKALQLEMNKQKIEQTNQLDQEKTKIVEQQEKLAKTEPTPKTVQEPVEKVEPIKEVVQPESKTVEQEQPKETETEVKSTPEVKTETKDESVVVSKTTTQAIAQPVEKETKTTQIETPIVETKPKKDGLQKSIIILSVIFILLLFILAGIIIYLWQQGAISF